MNIIVTGATSFIGLAVIRALVEKGHQIFAIVRPNSRHLTRLEGMNTQVQVIFMELDELDELPRKVFVPCQIFFHFGWDGAGSENRNMELVQQQNVSDSLKALKAAVDLGCKRFIFSGSQAEYGIKNQLMKETDSCEPVSPYAIAKTKFYQEAKAYLSFLRGREKECPEYIHARIFSIYGPGDHPWSLIESCLDTFEQEESISLGDCTQMWNFLYIDDLAEALLCLMEYQGVFEEDMIINLAGEENSTGVLREYVERMHEICGRKGSFLYGVRPPNAEGVINLIPDIEKMQSLTGWIPKVSFEEGIKRILEYKKENGDHGKR